jgi:2-keto-4-pentenoate hydratase/2-oxohepta-3-ene-1,7-dioic acid hydratase in catechol pathway
LDLKLPLPRITLNPGPARLEEDMKLLSFRVDGISKMGALVENRVLDLNAAFDANLGGSFNAKEERCVLGMLEFLDRGEERLIEAKKAVDEASEMIEGGSERSLHDAGLLHDIGEIKLLAPIPRPRKNIVCLGLNYADHVAEGSRTLKQQRPLPEHPIFFTKPPTAVTGPFDDIVYPEITERLDYEVELAVIIGKEGKYISEEEVYDHVVGYTVFNDVSARDLQRRHSQWYKGKSCDTFAPMGPYLVTPDEIGDPMNLGVRLRVNGETRQESNTSNMIFDIKKIVSTLSEGITLEAGDIIATGTPSGVGSAHPLGLLKIGDEVETWVEKIGAMRNRVVPESQG